MKSIPDIVLDQNAFFLSQKTKDIQYRLSLLKALKSEILKKEQEILDALNTDFKNRNSNLILVNLH